MSEIWNEDEGKCCWIPSSFGPILFLFFSVCVSVLKKGG